MREASPREAFFTTRMEEKVERSDIMRNPQLHRHRPTPGRQAGSAARHSTTGLGRAAGLLAAAVAAAVLVAACGGALTTSGPGANSTVGVESSGGPLSTGTGY